MPKRQSFTDDEFEQETLLFLKSNEVNNVKAMEHTNLKDLEVLTGSDKVKIYLESLLPNKDISSRTESEINGIRKNENDNNIVDQQQIPIKNNTDIQVLSQSSDSSLKYKSLSNNNNGVAGNKVRSTSQSQKQSAVKTPFKNVTDPTKELQEFISEIVSRVSNKEKLMDSCPTEDSSTTPRNKTLQEHKKKEVKSNMFGGCASHSKILQMKKLGSFECEKIVKRPRAASTGRIHKREISK